jgi:hypothetical protein
MYSRWEEERLDYIKRSQRRQARDIVQHTAQMDGVPTEDDGADDRVEGIELPASFLGSWRYRRENCADALALARRFARPGFFITATCNPNWPELQEQLGPGQTASDAPEITARVFHARLKHLMETLRKAFGPLLYEITVIEFQKRGLPHAHIIITVSNVFIFFSHAHSDHFTAINRASILRN